MIFQYIGYVFIGIGIVKSIGWFSTGLLFVGAGLAYRMWRA